MVVERACGTCGVQRRTCSNARWGEWQACLSTCASGDAAAADSGLSDGGTTPDAVAPTDTDASSPLDATGEPIPDGPLPDLAMRDVAAETASADATIDLIVDAASGPETAANDGGDARPDATSDAGDVSSDAGDGKSDVSSDAGDGKSDAPADASDGPVDAPVEAPPACVGCKPGTKEMEACGVQAGTCRAGTHERVCTDTCAWSAWGACGGTYVGPADEICGDGLDNSCDGRTDEGCGCAAVGPGPGGSFALAGTFGELVPDPKRCLVYGIDLETPQSLVVIDAAAKKELTRVPLPQVATDVDLSPNGDYLVVGYPEVHKIAVIDPSTWKVSQQVNAINVTASVEVNDAGHIIYGPTFRGIDIAGGIASDLDYKQWLHAPDIDLSRDGKTLFAATTDYLFDGNGVVAYAVNGTTLTPTRAADSAFPPLPELQDIYLSPGEQHVYALGMQYDVRGVRPRIRARLGQRVLASDSAATFAIGTDSVFDAELGVPIAALAHHTDAATLMAGDHELWMATTGRAYYVNVAAYVGGKALGARTPTPLALSAYDLVKIVADPVRGRLYGLDAGRRTVIAVDVATHAVVGAIVVGSLPSDLAVAPDGSKLYVGHDATQAYAVIDLATFAFSGFTWTEVPPHRIAVFAGDRALITDSPDNMTSALLWLVETSTGRGLSYSSPSFSSKGRFSATPDGKVVFSTNGLVYRQSTANDVLTPQSYTGKGGPEPYVDPEVITAFPDGSGFYYVNALYRGTDLATVTTQTIKGPIRSITKDMRLAIGNTIVYRLSDGMALGTLPAYAGLQALSADDKKLFIWNTGDFQVVDLTGY
jgi:DNA-binding beta-propeller fold protein YncE